MSKIEIIVPKDLTENDVKYIKKNIRDCINYINGYFGVVADITKEKKIILRMKVE